MKPSAPAQFKATPDQVLDALLIEWHQWFNEYQLTVGHSSTSATTKDHRSGGHMDWWNGAADDRAAKLQVRAVNEAMQRIPDHPQRWRTALEFHARNLNNRLTVWYSPRLPATREERDVLILEARSKLMMELRREGVMG